MDDGGEDDVIVAESSDIFTMWGKKFQMRPKPSTPPFLLQKTLWGCRAMCEIEKERERERWRKNEKVARK